MAGDGAPTPTRLGALSPPSSTRLSNNSVGPRYFTYDDGAATTTRNHSSKKPALGVAGGGNMSPSALSPRRSAAMGTTSPSSPGSTRSAVSMGNGSGTHRENGISPSMMKQRVASASGGGSPAGRPSGDSNSRPPASPRSPVVSPSRRKASAIGASLARTAAGGEEGRAAMMAERRSPGEGSRAGGESRRSDSRAEESRLTSGNDSGRTGGGIGSTRNGEKVAGVGSPRERLVSRELKERRERRDADARRRMSREVVEDVNDAKEVAREVDRVESVNETRGNDDGDSEVVSESEKNDAHTPLPDTTLSPRSKGESPRISMQKRMFANLRPPDSSLENLLTVLTDENTSHLRRVNACGAIKTLTLNKKNVIQLARTRGVISSITSVLCRVDASEEERTRCINALMDAKEVAREVDRVKSVNETRGEVPRLTRVVRQTNTTAKEGEATEIGMDSGKSRELISSRRISTPRTAPDDKPRRDIAAASPLREKPEAIAPSVRDDSSAEVIQGKSNSKIGMKVQGEATPAHETNDKRRQDGGSVNSDRDGNDDGDSEVVSESEKNDAHTPLPDTTLSPRSKGESPRISMQKRMFANLRPPDSSLENLLTVLTDENTSHLRRVNACGAIKTLTLNKKNVIQLARTRGVISSITSVLCRVDASEEERTRCINALMHLCVPEENWRLVYLFPQTAEALARNMADRYPQIRYAACLALSFLAKKNRKEVVKNTILMHSIARVLEVDKNGALERTNPQDRKVFIGSRLCALKMLLHLSKNKDISTKLARADCITTALARIASTMELAANILCVAIITNLTRHPDNASHLVFHAPDLLTILVAGTSDNSDQEICKCSLYALQNLSCTGSIRQELANAPDLLASITKNAFKTQFPEQQLSALHTLKNLSDDPFNLVTMTNTPGCTATLLALANDSKNGMAQFLACDTLATLSHWLLTLSAAKRCKEKSSLVAGIGGANGNNKGGGSDSDSGRRTFQTATWEMWC
eukprot:CAMPEP_0171447336 /NCGR_PEP_ID=MMETSP0881-20121228/39053_1 /TAXON_ID=67004 /ORGANISM="Thalassiosira weissflogii, Strain CCMP1336" /LENGTH=990 /DNA_ID=CAMNT_0011971745 /DNA_START=38 /DNA_END=3011 /DNA_ORIENTATION=+